MQNIDSDLIRGNIDTIILKTMLNEDKYGLDIIKEVSDRSSGTYELKQPTLYSCLKRLENQELISSYWVDSDIGGKRHYYKLTDKGRDFYNKKQEEWAKSKFIIDNLLSNYNYEEYRLVKKDEYDQIIQDKVNAPLSNLTGNLSENNDSEFLTENEEPSDNDNENSFDDEVIETPNNDDETDLNNEEYNSSSDNFSEEDYNFNSNENDEESSDFESNEPVYFESQSIQSENVEPLNNDYEIPDQSQNELNILSQLHSQDDDEINTYYGDQKSYVNHLRSLDESQLEQQNLLDDSLYTPQNLVNDSINSFSDNINKLKSFNNSDEETISETTSNSEDYEDDYQQNNDFQDQNLNDDLDELNNLNNNQNNGFFDSYDSANYGESYQNYDFEQTDSSDASFENENEYSFNDNQNYDFEGISNEIKSQTNLEENTDYDFNDNSDNSVEEYNDENLEQRQSFDDIVEQNMRNNFYDNNSPVSNNVSQNNNQNNDLFKPMQSSNYRDKLENLSRYSKVTLDEEKSNTINNDDAIMKAKNIAEITKELEEEGIKIKEHYKLSNLKDDDKNYLLVNKINLIKSVIMFFAYVFILSAIYIVLNNTNMKDFDWFSIKYFLLGFIPFAVIMLYYGIVFVINPHKKITSKYHARIMTFISVIITVQLLLITYCVNLQLGFYSFTQKQYNHLAWIIPTIISFAPVIDNFVYMFLFKSKNFHV